MLCEIVSLDGALGKIATRTRSAPRPLLQVKASSTTVPTTSSASPAAPTSTSSTRDKSSSPSRTTGESLLTGAGLVSNSATSTSAAPTGPLPHRAALALIERLYDIVLDLEQLRRVQPALLSSQQALQDQLEQMTVEGEVKEQMKERVDAAKGKVEAGETQYEEMRESLWQGLKVMDPLDAWYLVPLFAFHSFPC